MVHFPASHVWVPEGTCSFWIVFRISLSPFCVRSAISFRPRPNCFDFIFVFNSAAPFCTSGWTLTWTSFSTHKRPIRKTFETHEKKQNSDHILSLLNSHMFQLLRHWAGSITRNWMKNFGQPFSWKPRYPFILCQSLKSFQLLHWLWVSPKMGSLLRSLYRKTHRGTPLAGWFVMENPIKMDDLEVPLFQETSIF